MFRVPGTENRPCEALDGAWKAQVRGSGAGAVRVTRDREKPCNAERRCSRVPVLVSVRQDCAASLVPSNSGVPHIHTAERRQLYSSHLHCCDSQSVVSALTKPFNLLYDLTT